MGMYVGCDIGGTKTMVASAHEGGEILCRERHPTPEGLREGLDLLFSAITNVCDGTRPDGVGVAIGGPLDWTTGVVSPLHQPAWRGVPLKALLQERFACPVHIDVDTNVAALGEYRTDRERCDRFLYLTLSTGMGGGFVVDGELYRGAHGCHPEPGHIAVNYRCSHPENVHCECGLPDCLEALVSGNGIRRVYGKPAEELNETQWDEVAFNLGQGLRCLASLYCPDRIVVGGGVAFGRGQRLLDSAAEILENHLSLIQIGRASCRERV
jgi:glucokinase